MPKGSCSRSICARYALMFVALLFGGAAAAQDTDFSKVEIKTVPVADGIYMLLGQGGNIGVSVGEDGVFIIDDQFAPLTEKILAAIGELSEQPVRFVVNTHWHGDHTGGNENLARGGSVVVAHKNVRERLNSEQFVSFLNRTVPPQPKAALPVVTFTDALTLHLNGDDIDVIHVGPGHTDGDSVIHFRSANVIHTGDIFFNGLYPFIDERSGGDVAGVVAAADQILAMVDDDTRIIPGHGPIGNRADLKRYRDMLATVAERVREQKQAGKSRDDVIAAKPTSDFDADWGQGFLPPDRWVGIVYDATL